MNTNLMLIRSLFRNVRLFITKDGVKDNIMTQYILEQAKSQKETSETLCKAYKEIQHLADSYNCYLESQRAYHELFQQYVGAGERSIRETADLVGFKLPHDPK